MADESNLGPEGLYLHMWVDADVAVDAALALRTARLVCASLMHLASTVWAPDDSLPLLRAGKCNSQAPDDSLPLLHAG